ncbi:hypothetical protein RchiOBHm_Chr6g0266911 [Rosa chinensis]|uniref:Uncharacterized protein n=1 Tax=Rosa chinensis TaxID=74649 RepID=A0A2P6PPT4_ROSCH|nr:hypothetical protein RchiOBHm_Chr6g0266911 [Rosa chinensis]
MATHMISSSNHNEMMKQMKFPKFACRQTRVQSSSSSPCSVLSEFPKLKKKQPLSPQPLCADQKKKMMKVVKSLSSTATATSYSPLSPTKLHGALAKIRFADLILKAEKQMLALDKIEAVAKCELQQPYYCTLKELGILTRCDCAWSWGCWGGLTPVAIGAARSPYKGRRRK